MMIKIPLPLEYVQNLCHKHHIQRMLIFGSALNDGFGPESDIDILVEFEPDAVVTLFDMVDIQDELAALFGRSVDLTTPDGLSQYIRQDVLSQAQVIYDRAA